MLTLDRFKLYAHIDHADEDELIESLIRAADTAVRDMTGKEPPSDSDELFDTAVLQLTAHWYENRTPVTDTSVTPGAVYRADPAQPHRPVRPIPGKGGRKWR